MMSKKTNEKVQMKPRRGQTEGNVGLSHTGCTDPVAAAWQIQKSKSNGSREVGYTGSNVIAFFEQTASFLWALVGS